MTTPNSHELFTHAVDAWLEPGNGFEVTEKSDITLGSALLLLPDQLLTKNGYQSPYRNFSLTVERTVQTEGLLTRKVTLEPMDTPAARGPVPTPITYECVGDSDNVTISRQVRNLRTGEFKEMSTMGIAPTQLIIETIGRITTGLITQQFSASPNE